MYSFYFRTPINTSGVVKGGGTIPQKSNDRQGKFLSVITIFVNIGVEHIIWFGTPRHLNQIINNCDQTPNPPK